MRKRITNDQSSQKDPCLCCWPYANGEKHIGQIAGAYLPPDIFGRYQRMAGNDVLMVSGSDTHGTPITLQAERKAFTLQKSLISTTNFSSKAAWQWA